MPALACLSLRVCSLSESASFYEQALGMQVLRRSSSSLLLGWPHAAAAASIALYEAPSGTEGGWCEPDTRRDAFVWIGLSNLPNVPRTLERLAEHPSTSPKMQGELTGDTGAVGVVGHFRDPNGYALEALQSTLSLKESAATPTAAHVGLLCAERPAFGQLKVNTKDPQRTLDFYVNGLGMRLVSQISMSKFGLKLFFLAFTDETVPGDMDSPETRKWLWQSQFTQLELQHWDQFEPDVPLRIPPVDGQLGFIGYDIECEDVLAMTKRLQNLCGARVQSPQKSNSLLEHGTPWKCASVVIDPDGRAVRLVQK
ncbi:MAG: hypothetical protein SGPRY_009499 [Prymnesium sp.]